MSVLLVGISHHSAPVALLERVSLTESLRDELAEAISTDDVVHEVMIVSTCNRVEIYAAVSAFHPALDAIVSKWSQVVAGNINELSSHVYARYADAAVEHLFCVASGLDSMVIGEQQIIGQIRSAYRAADEAGTVGKKLHALSQRAFSVGKRVHTETSIDSAGASVVSVALDHAVNILSGEHAPATALSGRTACIVGAGAMGGLAVAHLGRAGISHMSVANRTPERAERLAEIARDAGTFAQPVQMSELITHIASSDILFTCTGAGSATVSLADVHQALTQRTLTTPLVICDLGLPRDVDPAVEGLPGVEVLSLEMLQEDPGTAPAAADAQAARGIVAEELANFTVSERVAEVGPLVAEMRKRARDVVNSEQQRLVKRLGDVDPRHEEEISIAMKRVVDKLLHPPTVRFKELAAEPNGSTYSQALRELFNLSSAVPQPEDTTDFRAAVQPLKDT